MVDWYNIAKQPFKTETKTGTVSIKTKTTKTKTFALKFHQLSGNKKYRRNKI